MTLPLTDGAAGLSRLRPSPSASHLTDTGPEWLRSLRKRALAQFADSGIPTTRDEEWKYTPVKMFEAGEWSLPAAAEGPLSEAVPFLQSGSVRIVLVDGRCTERPTDLPAGLTVTVHRADALGDVTGLQDFLGQSGSGTTRAGDRTIGPDRYAFGALNTGLFEDVVEVRIAQGSSIAPLVEIVHFLKGQGAGDARTVAFPRLLIVAEEDSQARIVETYLTDACNAHASVPVTEVFVRERAKLEHVRVQDQCECSTHIGLWQTRQGGDSEYKSYNVCFGSATARVDQTIWLEGTNAVTRLDGVVCASGEQHMDNHTRLDHAVPDCNSFEIYKQVVADSATVVFNGKIFVHQDAQKSDAKQTNQALLLSPKATVDSKPQLEIFADDVKCTHGATVGQLEETPLFYMRQRGMSKESAQALLVYAFAAEVLEMITIDEVRKALERKLYLKLGVDLS